MPRKWTATKINLLYYLVMAIQSLLHKKPKLIGAIVITIITFITFFPSLFHIARSDQLFFWFPHQVENMDNLFKLTFGSYAFTRTANNYDYLLFRPVLYFILGLETYFFKYNFFLWQLTSLLLHISVSLTLYKTLLLESKNILVPFLLSLLFAVLYVSMEMVIFHHIVGYLFFSLLFIATIYHLKKYILTKNKSSLFYISLFSLIGAFTYETSNIITLLLALFMLVHNFISKRENNINAPTIFPNWIIITLFIIPFIYLTASFTNLMINHRDKLYLLNQIIEKPILTSILNSFKAIFIWIVPAWLPNSLKMISFHRLVFIGLNNPQNIYLLINFIILLALIAIIYFKLPSINYKYYLSKTNILFTTFLFLTLFIFTFIIIHGRVNSTGPMHWIAWNTYYAYIPNIIFILILFQFLPLLQVRDHSFKYETKFNKLNIISTLCIFFLIFSNSYHTFAMNREMLEFQQPRKELLTKAEKLVKEHRQDHNFSFEANGTCEENIGFPPEKHFFLYSLYPKLYKPMYAKYKIECAF